MSEDYTTALWAEIGAWQELHRALKDQRAAIVRRDVETVWSSQEELQDLLGQVAATHARSQAATPGAASAEETSLATHAEILRHQARQELELNFQLLRDICCYLDMMREVVFPGTLPPTYRHPRDASRPGGAGVTVSRSA